MNRLRPLATLLAAVAALGCAAVTFAAAPAASARVNFDLPAADATVSLKLFAEQSGQEIVYPPDAVKGVRTNPVRGSLTARAAIDALVAGTPLAVVESKSGALAVNRTPAPNAPKAVAAPSPVRPEKPAAPNAARDDTVVLSPFTVATSKDDGFVPASSLAGGRLSTDLRDTPLAYSVLTSDFLDALNLTDFQTALSWTTGANNQVDYGVQQTFGSDNNISLRGGGSSPQRNFFFVSLNLDTYSTERIDIARGPNALLVGNGGFGGSAVTLTKRADPSRAFYRTQLQYGSWENRRATLDLNQPLTKQLALRINLLRQRADAWRTIVFDHRDGISSGLTFRPFKRTEIRFEGEYTRMDRINGINGQYDQVSGWDGRTVFDGVNQIPAADRAARGVQLQTGEILSFTPSISGTTVLNRTGSYRTQGAGAAAGVPVAGIVPLNNRTDSNFSGFQNTFLNEIGRPAGYFDAVLRSAAKFQLPGRDFVLTPNEPLFTSKLRTYSAFVEQQVGSHLFLEIAGNYTDTERIADYVSSRGLINTYLDLNQFLPDGVTRNPKYLEPYGESARYPVKYLNESLDGRVAAAVVFDDTRFGSFRANVIAGERFVRTQTQFWALAMRRNADPRQSPFSDLFSYRYYWSDNGTPYPAPDSVSYVAAPGAAPVNYKTQYMIALASTGSIRKGWQDFTYLQSTLNAKLFKNRLNLTGGVRRDGVVVHSQRVTTVPRVEQFPSDWDGTTVYFLPPAPADYFNLKYVPKDANGVPTAIATVADTRPRDAAGRGLPQYANDRFRSDYSVPDIDQQVTTVSYGGVFHTTRWLSAFYNFAETFNPSGANQRINGDLIPPQVSDGWDAGLRFTLFGGRATMTVGTYASNESNNSFNSNLSGAFTRLLGARKIGDFSSTGRNQRGLVDVPAPYFDFSGRKAKGKEVEIVANLTRNWRLTANATLPKVTLTNSFVDTFAYLTANDSALRGIVTDAGGLIDAAGLATVDQRIPAADRSPDVATAVNEWNTFQNLRKNSTAGGEQQRVNKYLGNVFADYRFTEGRFKNLRLGGGVQFRGPQIIGFRGGDTIVDPANPTLAIDDPNVDGTTAVKGASYHLLTATAGYERRLGKKMILTLNLRVANLLNEDKVIFTDVLARPPGGNVLSPARVATPRSYYYLEPRSYSLSARLSF